MIRLNLMPAEDRRRGGGASARRPSTAGPGTPARSAGTSPLVMLLLFPIVAGALAFAGYTFYQEKYLPQKTKEERQAALETLRAEVAQLEQQYAGLRETYDLYRRQARVINILMPENRLLWAEKLNQISACIPDNVYVTRIGVDEEVDQIEAPESIEARAAWEALPEGERGPEPTPLMIPSIVQTLSIEGITFADEDDRRIRLVLDFRDNLTSHQAEGLNGEIRRFMDHFAGVPHISYNRIRDLAGVTVNEFQLVLESVDLATLGGEPTESL
jgi:Tfp pilus assembly protein PilN